MVLTPQSLARTPTHQHHSRNWENSLSWPGSEEMGRGSRRPHYANGIGVSPDQKTLYVSETVELHFEVQRSTPTAR